MIGRRQRRVWALAALVALVLGLAGCAVPAAVPEATPTPSARASGGRASGPATPSPAAASTAAPSARRGQTPTVQSAEDVDRASGLRWVDLADLPPEASETLAEIRQGPPFPTRKDGTTFGNRERVLPQQGAGYYHEFTVPTPRSSDRGARRIVTGGPAYGTARGEFYYTDDHYASFERIRT